MASSPITTLPSKKSPAGWHNWAYAKNVVISGNNKIQIPDASFPFLYTPSNGIWYSSFIIHCLIPWADCLDPFTIAVIFATTGSINATLAGLAVVEKLLPIKTKLEHFSAGDAFAPSMGLCIGDKFKQQIYTTMTFSNVIVGPTIMPDYAVELLQNSKFKRVYVGQGEIAKYTNVAASEYTLDLGIETIIPPPSGSITFATGDKIEITKAANTTSDSITFTMDIIGIKDNWNIIIKKPPHDILPGDFYKLNKIWCLENPYLLSGFWNGTENDVSSVNPDVYNSGNNFYITSQNSPSEKGKFLGAYVWGVKSIPSDITTTTTTPIISSSSTTTPTTTTSTTTSTTTATTTEEFVVTFPQPSYGTNMLDNNTLSGTSLLNYTWAFLGFGNNDPDGVYPDNYVRFRETRLSALDGEGAVVRFTERIKATPTQYTLVKDDNNTSYIRVELATGGSRKRNNWFTPCLKGSYVKLVSNNKYYKILDQVAYNIIDVSIKSVDGSPEKFDPITNQEYIILNNNGWLLSEHYGRNGDGIFSGRVTSVSADKKKFTISGIVNDTVSVKSYGSVEGEKKSFIDRYQNTVVLPSNYKKMYGNFQNWILISSAGSSSIEYVDFSTANNIVAVPYAINVNLAQKNENLNINDSVYIAFDSTYKRFGSFGVMGTYALEANSALNGPAAPFMTADAMCLDGAYDSSPYRIEVVDGDRIGFCDGYYFGVEFNGSAASDYSQSLFFTTPKSARGVASLFHILRQEGWIAYNDPITEKLTLRRGSEDFKEYPKKDMVVLGKSQKIEPLSNTNPIALNTNYDMLRKIQIKFPLSSDSTKNAIMFGIGDSKNIYGFCVSGDGIVNLKTLTIAGIPPGATPASTFRYNNFFISPVYIYKPNWYQNLQTMTVDVGTSTKDGPLYINDGNVDELWGQYISDHQTISNNDVGFFDVIRLADGEVLLIYDLFLGPFKIGDNLNNSSSNNTSWDVRRAVMIAGTYDDDFTWCCPMTDRIDDTANINRFPLMVLNNVDYLAVIYNPLCEELAIFVRCYLKSTSYLGCFRMKLRNNFPKYLCDFNLPETTGNLMNVLWKPPLIPDAVIMDENQSWTDKDNIINDGFSFGNTASTVLTPSSGEIDGLISEHFTRVMGPDGTDCDIIGSSDIGVISTSILPDGTYAVFIDTSVGIKALFSNDNGARWFSTNNIFARNGRSAVMVERYLFYIVASGIEVKHTNITDYYSAVKIGLMTEGNLRASEEIQLQRILDQDTHFLIGSGEIEPQRLSGYVSSDGTFKIFFYDSNNLLKCMESKDGFKWEVANNF